MHHDVEVMGTTPIKQHPYRVNPVKLQFLRKLIICWEMVSQSLAGVNEAHSVFLFPRVVELTIFVWTIGRLML